MLTIYHHFSGYPHHPVTDADFWQLGFPDLVPGSCDYTCKQIFSQQFAASFVEQVPEDSRRVAVAKNSKSRAVVCSRPVEEVSIALNHRSKFLPSHSAYAERLSGVLRLHMQLYGAQT
jgi:hypothetical protein